MSNKLFLTLLLISFMFVVVSCQDPDVAIDWDPENVSIIWEEEFPVGENEGTSEETSEMGETNEESIWWPDPDDVACYNDPNCIRDVYYCDQNQCCWNKECDENGFCEYSAVC